MKQTRILELALKANHLLWEQAFDDFLKSPTQENIEQERTLYREGIELSKLLGAYNDKGGLK